MLLFLSTKERLPQAKELLTELGLKHSVYPYENGSVLEISTETSIFSPQKIVEKLSFLGIVKITSHTPILDSLPENYSVELPAKAFGKLEFRKNPETPIWIAGPCALDTPENLRQTAKALAQAGVKLLRGGALKPRTSPHDFQGVGRDGYRWLADIAHEYGMAAISEALSEEDVEEAFEHLDIVQVGARNMQNFALLRLLGQGNKPILLKRAPGATLKEWAAAAEYILAGGNKKVILCERGVRGLEEELRYTLDFAGAAWMQLRYHLPVVIDPSHATGSKPLLQACTAGANAMGFAGVMLECHPRPVESKSDSLQALRLEECCELIKACS